MMAVESAGALGALPFRVAGQAGDAMDRTGSDPLPSGAIACARVGRNWRVGWAHRSVSVRHSVGMQHLAILLNNPDKEIHSLDLVAALSVVADVARQSTGQPLLDRRAIQQYRHRISQLADEIDEYEAHHDYENASRLRAEHDWLVQVLSAATGISGYIRDFSDGGERARIAVGKAIRRAVAHIAAVDAAIGEHLRDSVHTGIRCAYWRTGAETRWYVRQST
jgi:hypothetical protein